MKRSEHTVILLVGYTYKIIGAYGGIVAESENYHRILRRAKRYHKNIGRTGNIYVRMVGKVGEYEYSRETFKNKTHRNI